MKRVILLLFGLTVFEVNKLNAAAVANPAEGYFNAHKELGNKNPGALFGLLETVEAYFRAQAVVNDLESVLRYFNSLGFDIQYLVGIKGRVEDKIKTLKEIKQKFPHPKEQTPPVK